MRLLRALQCFAKKLALLNRASFFGWFCFGFYWALLIKFCCGVPLSGFCQQGFGGIILRRLWVRAFSIRAT